ncbi:hypothetical protein CR513_54796, partial [Mucuna pruriens]
MPIRSRPQRSRAVTSRLGPPISAPMPIPSQSQRGRDGTIRSHLLSKLSLLENYVDFDSSKVEVRQPHHVQVRASNVQSLRYWASCLKGPWRRRFEKLHDNLLSLLEVETQPAALGALAQYYDSSVCCFTFKDFQIAPTLEEYERLLGLPLTKSPLYFHQGQPPFWATIARLLRVSEAEMSKQRRNRNGLEGIPRVYIEERLLQFQEEQHWDAMMDILGLLLYGVVLFPYIEDYIDLAAIEEFLAKRDRGENPTIAVLANTYYTLSYCSGRKTGSFRCCTPLFYLWLTAHFFQCKTKTTCPIEDFKWSCVKTMTKEQWVRRLGEATERTIRWYPTWNERQEMITNCGKYPNVPLLGTQGAINYNPELTSRQKERKPTEENTIEKFDVPRLTLSEKGQRGEPEAVGPPQNTGLGLSSESIL